VGGVDLPIPDLRTRYLEYLAVLNERRFDDLGEFLAEDAVHNGSALGVAGYRAMLQDDVATFPDLFFEPLHVVADGAMVAARLGFDCTPEKPFRGVSPGTRVQFTEHVFYRFAGPRIAQVWSLLGDPR